MKGRSRTTAEAPHRIRIIGGQWKRTPISVIDRPGLRPTPDRVRETLFNWIGPSIKGISVLDLFGGSGALGFEAASRGAADVVIVESDTRAVAGMRELKERLAAEAIETIAADALSALMRLGHSNRRFGLILLDPPFHSGWFERVVPLLSVLLSPAAFLYLESERALSMDEVQAWLGDTPLARCRQGRAGQVYYHLFELAN